MSWRVGSKTGVTLFKGDELYGMLLDPEKAAVVVRWLNMADAVAGRVRGSLALLDDEDLTVLIKAATQERWRREDAAQTDRRQAEGGAEGGLAAVVPEPGVGAGGAVGAGDRGGCPSGCDGGGPDGHF